MKSTFIFLNLALPHQSCNGFHCLYRHCLEQFRSLQRVYYFFYWHQSLCWSTDQTNKSFFFIYTLKVLHNVFIYVIYIHDHVYLSKKETWFWSIIQKNPNPFAVVRFFYNRRTRLFIISSWRSWTHRTHTYISHNKYESKTICIHIGSEMSWIIIRVDLYAVFLLKMFFSDTACRLSPCNQSFWLLWINTCTLSEPNTAHSTSPIALYNQFGIKILIYHKD